MKNQLRFVFIFLLVANGIFAQQQKYYRVKLFTGDKGLQKLSGMGVAIDHGEVSKGHYFVSDFSEYELNLIKQSKINYKILIDDVSAYYVKNSKNANVQSAFEKTPCATYATPVNFKLGTMGGFYKYAELLAALDSMAKKYPNLITARKLVSATQTTAQGRPLYYVKISDNPNVDESEPKILYTSLHHAREPEGLSELIYYMWYLLENYKTDPNIKNLVDSTEMYFVPCVNPDGYVYNETTNPKGGGMWRKNRKKNADGTYGVDLNRNYGYQWGYDNTGSSNVTSSDAYRGPSAFSEAETQMMRSFCQSHNFYMALNAHSYGNYLINPFCYKTNLLTPDSGLYKSYASQLANCNAFATGTANQTVGYVANGNTEDWLYGEQSIKNKIISFSAEIGPSADGFWPASSRIIPIAQANLDMDITAAMLTKQSVLTSSSMIAANKSAVQSKQLNRINFVNSLSNAPNPCNSYTFINYELNKVHPANLKLEVLNSSGSVVQSINLVEGQSKVLVNTTNLQAGIYTYTITNGETHSEIKKFIIMK